MRGRLADAVGVCCLTDGAVSGAHWGLAYYRNRRQQAAVLCGLHGAARPDNAILEPRAEGCSTWTRGPHTLGRRVWVGPTGPSHRRAVARTHREHRRRHTARGTRRPATPRTATSRFTSPRAPPPTTRESWRRPRRSRTSPTGSGNSCPTRTSPVSRPATPRTATSSGSWNAGRDEDALTPLARSPTSHLVVRQCRRKATPCPGTWLRAARS